MCRWWIHQLSYQHSRETGLIMSSSNPSSPRIGRGEVGSSLFDACRNGDIDRVKLLLTLDNVNARDVPGRKSSPLHFAAGLYILIIYIINF